MKILFKQSFYTPTVPEADLSLPSLQEDIEKTHIALEIAYAGFDNAIEPDMIDCYIYEINALLKRYKHLTELSAREQTQDKKELHEHSSIRTLVSHVFS